jgi:hypothetical protein
VDPDVFWTFGLPSCLARRRRSRIIQIRGEQTMEQIFARFTPH